ncbi:MAG: hypothetical protein ACQXXF_00215 [Thermoplasmatota archaeon]
MFIFAMAVWAFIEGIGLITGMRTYSPSEDAAIIFIFVSFVEDPRWVCLSYMIAEQIFKKLYLNKK